MFPVHSVSHLCLSFLFAGGPPSFQTNPPPQRQGCPSARRETDFRAVRPKDPHASQRFALTVSSQVTPHIPTSQRFALTVSSQALSQHQGRPTTFRGTGVRPARHSAPGHGKRGTDYFPMRCFLVLLIVRQSFALPPGLWPSPPLPATSGESRGTPCLRPAPLRHPSVRVAGPPQAPGPAPVQ